MSELQIFNNEEFGEIRTVEIDGEPWFVGKDVAQALGYSDTRKAVVMHVDEDDKTNCPITDSLGREQETTIINESGIYALVFGSKLESAKRFKHWITSEVLPAIRKTGSYHMPQTYAEALRALADKAEEAERLAIENNKMKPKADFFDAVADSKDAIEIGQVAKVLNLPGIGRNKLFGILRAKGVLMNDNIPYQKYIDKGYFRTIEQKYTMPDGETRISIKTLAYQKGVDAIRKLLMKIA